MSMPANVIPLGSRLRQRREELGLSQAQAARELDVARTAYRLWEMEAARPAPDRWRAIASWLGVSMTAMLRAGELLSGEDADDADEAAVGAGMTAIGWDTQSGDSPGDYFTQQRSMIADQARTGAISRIQATHLGDVVDRLQHTTALHTARGWYPGRFRKRFVCDELAPSLARAAIATTAVGIPADAFHNALLLTTELVTNSVKHSGSSWVEVGIAVEEDRLRVDVSDDSTRALRPRTPDIQGGWGMTLIAELATGWGTERTSDGKTIWIELALSP
jgi:transcriptional regulator with XRE-family HTH domain